MKLLSRNPDKPKKKLESTIGKIIYGFLLFMPLLSILITSMYAVFNKNAYMSYSASEQVTTFLPINNTLSINKEYYFDSDTIELSAGSNQSIATYKNSPIIQQNNTILVAENKMFDFRLHKTSATYLFIRYFDSNNELQSAYLGFNDNFHVTFTFEVGNNYTLDSLYNDFIHEVNTEVENYIDNAFDYGIQKVENNNLYNWAKETGTYDVLHNTTTLLGIENTFIPMLLAYWLMISIMYFIYDIALMLIMVVHRKIHELQESI